MTRIYSQLSINEKINVKAMSHNIGVKFGALPNNYIGAMFTDIALDRVFVWEYMTDAFILAFNKK